MSVIDLRSGSSRRVKRMKKPKAVKRVCAKCGQKTKVATILNGERHCHRCTSVLQAEPALTPGVLGGYE